MRRFRFTIGSLLGVVVFLAVAFAALREATDLWDSGVFSLSLLTMLTAVLLTVYQRERKRAFWLGFALFGWAYMTTSLIAPIESRLPTTKGLAYLDSPLPERSGTITVSYPGGAIATGSTVRRLAFSTDRLWSTASEKLLSGPNGSSENFLRIGHSLLALVLAFLGGCLSRSLYSTSQSERAEEPDVLPLSPSPPNGT
jgi:hypothetical protein